MIEVGLVLPSMSTARRPGLDAGPCTTPLLPARDKGRANKAYVDNATVGVELLVSRRRGVLAASNKRGRIFRVGIFLDFVGLIYTYAPWGASYVRGAKRNRVGPPTGVKLNGSRGVWYR